VTGVWVDVCATDDIDNEDVIEVQARERALAIYRSPQDTYHATGAVCTHGGANLADGLVMGDVIECPKHNGRFDYRTGAAVRVPCLDPLVTYPVRVQEGRVLVELPAGRAPRPVTAA
jgi:3-phenylpropionate/trans-cinnamate dioxygenase ferredoxin subunit